MALPQLTDEQRKAALEKAAAEEFFTISSPFIRIAFFSSLVFSLAIEETEKSFKT